MTHRNVAPKGELKGLAQSLDAPMGDSGIGLLSVESAGASHLVKGKWVSLPGGGG